MDPVEYDIRTSGYAAAFGSIRTAKNLMWVLLGLCLLIQIAGFGLVHFAGIIGSPAPAQAAPVIADTPAPPPPATLPATTQEVTAAQTQVSPPAPAEASQGGWKTDSTLYQLLFWLLPATKFLAFVLTLLLVLTLMFATKLSLLGRLGGIVGFVGAFFWSLLLLALVTPWQQVVPGSLVSGATFNLGDLMRDISKLANDGWLTKACFYARYLAYPVIALVVWLIVQMRFGAGYKQSSLSSLGSVPNEPTDAKP